MRKISKDAYNAFIQKRKWRRSNTIVTYDKYGISHMYLFGNEIAIMRSGDISISSGDYYPTTTTRDRLSAFVNISIYKGEFIINNKKWDGKWTNINKFN